METLNVKRVFAKLLIIFTLLFVINLIGIYITSFLNQSNLISELALKESSQKALEIKSELDNLLKLKTPPLSSTVLLEVVKTLGLKIPVDKLSNLILNLDTEITQQTLSILVDKLEQYTHKKLTPQQYKYLKLKY